MNNRLFSSLIAVASILIFFLLILPAFDQTLMLRGSVKDRENILRESEEISNRIRELNLELENKRGETDKLDKLLPKQKEIPELLANLEAIVSASGLLLTEINLSETSGLEEIRKINGTLKLIGSFASFTNFLDLLERNLRLIDVTAFDVAAQFVEGTKAINYDVRFEIHYLASE